MGNLTRMEHVWGLSMQYIPIEKMSLYHSGVGAGPQYSGIPCTYFPLRRGGKVTLYQDAHVPCDSLPTTEIDGDTHYVHGTCWIDIFDAIKNARRLLYITGWSVCHEVRLVRETVDAPTYTLGDLLKTKSQEGVKSFASLFGMILLQGTSWATNWQLIG